MNFFLMIMAAAAQINCTNSNCPKCPVKIWQVKVQCERAGNLLQLSSHEGTYHYINQNIDQSTVPKTLICRYQAGTWTSTYEILSADSKKEEVVNKKNLYETALEINKLKQLFDLDGVSSAYGPFLSLKFPLDVYEKFDQRYNSVFLFTGIDNISAIPNDLDARTFQFMPTKNPALKLATNLYSEVMPELLSPNLAKANQLRVSMQALNDGKNEKADEDILTGSHCVASLTVLR